MQETQKVFLLLQETNKWHVRQNTHSTRRLKCTWSRATVHKKHFCPRSSHAGQVGLHPGPTAPLSLFYKSDWITHKHHHKLPTPIRLIRRFSQGLLKKRTLWRKILKGRRLYIPIWYRGGWKPHIHFEVSNSFRNSQQLVSTSHKVSCINSENEI